MIYPDWMTIEDIEEFELDMARYEHDPSMPFDQINKELRLIYLEHQLTEQAELLQFYND